MSFYAYLKFFHILFVALFVGAFTAVAILWVRGRLVEDPVRRLAFLEAVVLISRRLEIVAGSILLLAGTLMLVVHPALFRIGPLFHIKITLGVLVVAVSHMASARMKRLYAAISEGREEPRAERFMDRSTWIGPALAFVVLFLGVLIAHG